MLPDKPDLRCTHEPDERILLMRPSNGTPGHISLLLCGGRLRALSDAAWQLMLSTRLITCIAEDWQRPKFKLSLPKYQKVATFLTLFAVLADLTGIWRTATDVWWKQSTLLRNLLRLPAS